MRYAILAVIAALVIGCYCPQGPGDDVGLLTTETVRPSSDTDGDWAVFPSGAAWEAIDDDPDLMGAVDGIRVSGVDGVGTKMYCWFDDMQGPDDAIVNTITARVLYKTTTGINDDASVSVIINGQGTIGTGTLQESSSLTIGATSSMAVSYPKSYMNGGNVFIELWAGGSGWTADTKIEVYAVELVYIYTYTPAVGTHEIIEATSTMTLGTSAQSTADGVTASSASGMTISIESLIE